MADYFLVRLARGAAWDHSLRRREQAGWEEHAAFMDLLVDEGVVVLGGPVGEGDGEDSLLVVDLDNEAGIRDRLAEDPWVDQLLTIKSIEPWSVWLRAPGGSV
ncbi:MAG: YciI family protein [Actinomycetota bacterium]|nr:YciI family protein [Actinomycetota bacterium]